MLQTQLLPASPAGFLRRAPAVALPRPQPLVSLLIPAYNESARLGATLARVLAYLAVQPYASEVLVIDDGSADDTAQQAAASLLGCPTHIEGRLISYQPNQGKGYAVRQGLLAAQGRIAVFSDADLSTPITELPRLLAPILADDYDVVFGSRALESSRIGVAQPLLRRLSGRLFNAVVRSTTGLPFRDTQCGFKAFRLAVCRPAVEGTLLDRYGFDVELLYLTWRAGLRLREQPVAWNHASGSKVGLLSGLYGFRELQQLRQHTQRGRYDAAMRRTRAAARALAGPVASR